jgi:tetratricopeptide (TPR) repeat protein
MIALVLFAPACAQDSPSLATIAAALHESRAQDAENMATQMLAAGVSDPLNGAYLLMDRGLAREQMGRRAEAVKDFTKAIDSQMLPRGDLARAYFDRGVTLDEMGRTNDAIADYTSALKQVPGYATALNNRANAYRRMGRYTQARSDYQASLAAGNDQPEYPLYGLGRVAEAQGDPVMAKAFYQRALAANGNFAAANKRMAALTSVGDTYVLRAPDEPATGPITAAPAHAREEVMQPQSVSGDPSDGLMLRPAILDVHKKRPERAVATHVAAFVPPQPSAGAPAGDRGDLVQLGAWRNQGDAALGWNKAAAAAGDLLTGASPRIVEADIPGKGHFWRLRTQAPAGVSAVEFCGRLRSKGLSCIAAPS